MYIMDMNTYYHLYGRLNKLSDIEEIHKQTGFNKEMLLTMLTQKIVRETKRRYYRVKARESYFARMWDAGDSVVKMAEEIRFSPVLLGGMILGAKGMGRKKFHQIALNPSTAPTPRLKKEFAEMDAADVVYSKWGFDTSVARGKEGERRLYEWLDANGIKYKTEEDLKALNYRKTPDALLEKPIIINGRTIRWIDSKASFGDDEEHRQNTRKQLGIYVDMFGEGMAVYWFGITEKTSTSDCIYLMTNPIEDAKEWKFAGESHPKHVPKCDIYRSPAPQGQYGPYAYQQSRRPQEQAVPPHVSRQETPRQEPHRPSFQEHRHEPRREEREARSEERGMSRAECDLSSLGNIAGEQLSHSARRSEHTSNLKHPTSDIGKAPQPRHQEAQSGQSERKPTPIQRRRKGLLDVISSGKQ